MGFLTEDELSQLIPSEMLPHTTPIPTQIISSGNNMRIYGIQRRTDLGDRFGAMKEEYLRNGAARSNPRYGYARRPEASAG